MNKKNLFLISGIITGIVFIISLLDADSGSLFGSVWFFRLSWLLLSISSFIGYFNLKKVQQKLD